MDLFIFNPRYGVLLCKPCAHTVPPSHLCSHITTIHSNDACRFESVVLNFLAVLGIDESPGGIFRSPLSYSPDLFNFIKIAHMLVI